MELCCAASALAKSKLSRSQSQLASLLVQGTPTPVRQAFLRSISAEDQVAFSVHHNDSQDEWSGNFECRSGDNEVPACGNTSDIGETSALVQNLMTSTFTNAESRTFDVDEEDAVASQQPQEDEEVVLNVSAAEDMVSLFADRLSAITHGFYLHCCCESVLLQRLIGCLSVYLFMTMLTWLHVETGVFLTS